ncbi:MAG: hypothetical protein OXR73_32460 [Myxococcales bacterium]|nr:hypothetical protein [Myxococcales bacterium]
MMEPSAAEALALLDQVRSFYGLSASGVRAEREPERTQLRQAYPLLCMMVARLQANPGETERADIKHGWQKALRRRSWDVLPPLGAASGSLAPPAVAAESSPPRSGPATESLSSSGGPAGSVQDADLGPQIAAFLAMFGVAVDPTTLPLQMFPTLPGELVRLVPMAEALRSGPLLAPAEYAERWRLIADAWNAVVGQSALRIPG